MLKLRTPLYELHLHEIPRLAIKTAQKLAVAIAAASDTGNPLHVTIEDLLHYLPIRWYEALSRGFIWLPAPARAIGLVGLALVVRQVASFEMKPYIYFQF